MQFSLSTGKGTYPFSIAVTTVSGGNWLTVDNSTGTVGSTGTVVNLGINRAAVRGGTYAGQVTMAATVNGTSFVANIAVTLNLEANRILVTASSVGLSQVGGTSVLTRTVQVLSGLGRTDVPWTASSDSPWLTVTGSGTTGGNLVIQANPGTLPSSATQFANVTVSSPDPTVENQQTIRVGLYLSSTAATDDDVVGGREHPRDQPRRAYRGDWYWRYGCPHLQRLHGRAGADIGERGWSDRAYGVQ